MTYNFISDDSERIIYNALPQVYSKFHHSDGETIYDSAYLVEYWEQIYKQWLEGLTVFVNYSGDLSVFTDEQLDSFAPFFGFSEDYYDPNWTKDQKIALFSGVYKDPYIWRFRGSRAVFNYLAGAFGIEAYLTTDDGFIAGISKAGDICGDGSGIGEIVVKYPSTSDYFDNSLKKGYLNYLVRYFIPAHIHVTLLATDFN